MDNCEDEVEAIGCEAMLDKALIGSLLAASLPRPDDVEGDEIPDVEALLDEPVFNLLAEEG